MGDLLSTVMRWLEARLTDIGQGNVALALAATGVLLAVGILLGLFTRRVFRRFDRRLATWEGTRLRGFRLQRQELLSAEDTTNIVRGVVRWLSYAVYVFLAYVVLQLIFLAFPTTRPVGTRLLTSLVGAVGSIGASIVNFLPSLFLLTLFYVLFSRAAKVTGLVFRGLSIGRIKVAGFDPEWAKPTFKIVQFLIWVFFLVIAFPYLPGSNSPAFQGVSIFLGVLLSLGSTGAASNVVSGIVLTYTRAFRAGDRVRIGATIGTVVDRTLFVTRVRTSKLAVITIPNSIVMNSHVVNYTTDASKSGVFLQTKVTIGYDVPWRKVQELLLEAARATDQIESDPEPFVLQTALDDFNVSYELNAATRRPHAMPTIYSDLHGNIQDRFHEAGIEIASPHLHALRDGNQPAVPAENLSPDFRPGAFRFVGLGP